MGRYKKRPMDGPRVVDAMCETVFLLEGEHMDPAKVWVDEDSSGYSARHQLSGGLTVVVRFTARMLVIDIGKRNGDAIDWVQGDSPQQAYDSHRARLKPAVPLPFDDSPVRPVLLDPEEYLAEVARRRAAAKALDDIEAELKRLHEDCSLMTAVGTSPQSSYFHHCEQRLRELYGRLPEVEREWRDAHSFPWERSAREAPCAH